MKTNSKQLFKGGMLITLAMLSSTAHAVEKPKTMDEMWKIIQVQQKQIEALTAKSNTTPAKTEATGDVKTLERKTDVLSQEVEKLRTNLSIPEEAKYKSMYGLGPAASKVYSVGKGLSIGGYGEAMYQNFVGKKGDNVNNADMERMVLYAGYKFSDSILFNSELEFEHATTGEGSESKGEVSVEFAALDFFLDPMANIRAGLVLMPMGFINQMHEPPFYFGNHRPEVEQFIIPSTWREMGLGLFGQITPELSYTAYAVNGLDAKNFNNTTGLHEGSGVGSMAKAESFGFVGRVDYTPEAVAGLTVGSSAYVGESGQNQTFAGKKAKILTQLYEGHVQWKYRGFEFRALGSWGHINNAGLLSADKGQTIGSSNYGWYTELGYDIMPLLLKDTNQYLAPFFRYEHINMIAQTPDGFANDPSKNWQTYQVGLQYKPIPNVVLKADYRKHIAKQGAMADDFNLGFGFIF